MQGYAYANSSPVTMSDPTGLVAASGPDGVKTCDVAKGSRSVADIEQERRWKALVMAREMEKAVGGRTSISSAGRSAAIATASS